MKTASKKSTPKAIESFEEEKRPFKIKSREELPELIRNLSVVDKSIPDLDYKAEYGKYLEEKYLKR